MRSEPNRGVLFDLTGPQGGITLEVERLQDGARYFTARDGLAYTHHGPVDHANSLGLRKVIEVVHGDALTLVPGS